MCGIVGYIGEREAPKLLLFGLEALEYRGYDSAGIATLSRGGLSARKLPGRIGDLKSHLARDPLFGSVGIGHTRWATHGEPSALNAHPHLSQNGRVAVVHNGIIENYRELRRELEKEGFHFASQTDTEVIPHLIERELRTHKNNTLQEAVGAVLSRLQGAYALAVLSADHPGELVAARESSPLIVGIGEKELFLASDEMAFPKNSVRGVIHVRDGEYVSLQREGLYRFAGAPALDAVARVEEGVAEAEESLPGKHPHLMLKEIYEQPTSLATTLSGRLRGPDGRVLLGGLRAAHKRLREAERLVLVGCGTSLYAAQAGKLLIESVARMQTEVVQAAEFRYSDPILSSRDVVIGISQSGETADTLWALKLAKEREALCLGITNRVGSALSKLVEAGVYLRAGPERAVASTKSFTSQVAVLTLLALHLGALRGSGNPSRMAAIAEALGRSPALIEESLSSEPQIQKIAEEYKNAKRIFCLGRGFGVPVALEGALKLKEIAYLDAEGYSAAELKHGPLALIEEGVPVVAIVRRDGLEEKMRSNLEEVATRGGDVIAFVPKGDADTYPMARHVIELPDAPPELTPLIVAPALQLLAYHLGVLRGVDIDRPRNLAKSVTVE